MASTQLITPLRQRMLDDMKLRNMALSTRRIYVSSVAGFSVNVMRSTGLTMPAVTYTSSW